jgi:hypothetical protein
VSAGGSQAVLALKSALKASAFWRAADRSARQSAAHSAGCLGELRTCARLSTLALQGVHHLDDRRWRGGGQANLDHLVVGPSGVFVVDSKNWVGRIDVTDGQLRQDGVPRDERLIALSWLAGRVDEVLATTSAPTLQAAAVACFTRPSPHLPPALGRIRLVDEPRLAELVSAGPPVLHADQVAELVEVLAYAFPPYEVDAGELAQAQGVLFDELQSRHAGLRVALERPVEEWTVWLHPEQARFVRRSFSGPARIRGAAGTGKSAVALHRVAWLAETRGGRYLVTSYVTTLPAILRESYATLSPATRHQVEFTGLHRWAIDFLAARGKPVRCDTWRAKRAFDESWARHGDSLVTDRLKKDYFKEEVETVVKGRALRDLDAYLELDRGGRRVPLGVPQRRTVWRLAQAYDAALAAARCVDTADVLRLARDELRRQPLESPYAGVVVDEVQDLPLVGLQLAHELAGGDRSDGLLLIGDGQQAVYPGAVRLAEAGISVTGRAVVLRTNYRNTVEILAAAWGVVAGDEFDDLDGAPEPGERDVEVVRHGEVPQSVTADTVAEHDAALVWDLQAALGRGLQPGDVALLCPTNAMAEEYAELLQREGIPAVLLKSAAARSAPAVRVGTYQRAKGLEFPHVVVPRLDKQTMLLTSGGCDARAEREELARRQLFVALTRARDSLWLGRVGGGGR